MIKLLSRKTVFPHEIFTVSKDHLLFPNNIKRTHHTVQRSPGVYVFPVDENYNLYLVEQYRYLHKTTSLESIAGLVEEKEDPLDAAKRELQEEAGITAKKWKKLGEFKPAGSIMTWDQHMYLAQDLEYSKQNLEDTENIKVVKLSLDDAVKKVFSNEIIVSSTVIGILMIDKIHREGRV